MKRIISLAIFSTITFNNAFATCLPKYDQEIEETKRKVKILNTKKEGTTTMGAIARTLGATAIGVTAGGTVGFVLPYAITGLTYGAMGIATGLTAAGMAAPFPILGMIAETQIIGDSHGVTTGLGVIGNIILWIPTANSAGSSVTSQMMRNGLRPATRSMFGAAGKVGASLVPLASTYFLPIGAAIGGLAGLGVGISDSIKNVRIKNLDQAQSFIKSAQLYLESDRQLDRLAFNNYLEKFPRELVEKVSPQKIAQLVVESNKNGFFCDSNNVLGLNQIKKVLKKAYISGTFNESSVPLSSLKSAVEENKNETACESKSIGVLSLTASKLSSVTSVMEENEVELALKAAGEVAETIKEGKEEETFKKINALDPNALVMAIEI
jgi:hypothetical protein